MVKNKNKNNRRISPSDIALIGAVIIVLGGFFLFSNLIEEKRLFAFDYMNELIASSAKEVVNTSQVAVTNKESKEAETVSEQLPTNTYIGYLEIPKLGFKRGFYSLASEANNVDQNIEVINGSQMPDKDKGNLIIAGHSGTAWNSFFKTLNQLAIGDKASVIYQDKTYTYQITKIYRQANTGKISIKRDYQKTSLTLVTCTSEDASKTQTIYIAELISTT